MFADLKKIVRLALLPENYPIVLVERSLKLAFPHILPILEILWTPSFLLSF